VLLNILIPKRNSSRPKNMQAELHSTVRSRVKIVFLVIRRQDDRDNTACLKIESRSQITPISAEVKHYCHSCI